MGGRLVGQRVGERWRINRETRLFVHSTQGRTLLKLMEMTDSPRFTRPDEPKSRCPIQKTSDNAWTVRDFRLAEQLMSSKQPTRQWGFGASALEKLPTLFRRPVLYMEGEEHRKMRSKTARFFSPRRTREIHINVIKDATQEALELLRAKNRVQISDLAMRVATRVAAHIVGLTNSNIDNLEHRLEKLASSEPPERDGIRRFGPWIRQQFSQISMYVRHVRPAIRARRKTPQDDLISHLLDENYSDGEIVGESVTYGTAGVVTTRQFICACVWHMHQDPKLLDAFLEADDPQSDAILYEILRIEPVVGKLVRKSTDALCVDHEGESIEIAKHSEINFEIYDINADTKVVGEDPDLICPHRAPSNKRPPTFSFGSGHHRCPGEYVAILETRIFLKALFGMPGLRIEGTPKLDRNETLQGYEIEGIYVCV